MPRKRKPKFSHSSVVKPGEDYDPVRAALVGIDEVAALPGAIHEQLIECLVTAIRFACGGVNAGKRHISNQAMTRHVFLADIACALEQAGLPVKRWQHDYDGGESLFYRTAHALAAASSLRLPRNLRPPAQQAARIEFGKMSPSMKAAQDAELAARRHRLDQLARRLMAAAP